VIHDREPDPAKSGHKLPRQEKVNNRVFGKNVCKQKVIYNKLNIANNTGKLQYRMSQQGDNLWRQKFLDNRPPE
jgi:hypothetical protein